MTIIFNKVQRKNPAKPDEPMKWYPVLRRIDLMEEEEVTIEIADETTLNPREAGMALSLFKKVLIRALLNGRTVKLGNWGTFRLTITTKGSATEKEVTADKVKKINIRFIPGKELKEAIAKAQLRDIKTLSKKK
ncbi:HU family DNA-binding protein [Hoylesella enoeca]|uniref:DNA-binding protein n=1 Tax=Hoylesella enoeca TaxID=76123 RepID=A0A0S2KM19_9BACT|nr:HU family DNA-binding protein [Hoylesella enoeca]ALO49361.1 DNA-binding protein [Hoylesella enoeca]